MTTSPQRRLPADERHKFMLTELRQSGRLDARELAEQLAVTVETVRKDLIQLERYGRLRRVHGGAVLPEALTYESNVTARSEFTSEKGRIARAALAYVPQFGAVLIDAGSTTERLAELFPADRELSVFTNALPIAGALVSKPALRVYTLGGRLRDATLANVGAQTELALREINVDVAFLGTNAISIERGLTTPDPEEASVKRVMLQAARRRVLLCDHSKFGLMSTAQHAEVRDIDVLITDREPASAPARALQKAGVVIEVAD